MTDLLVRVSLAAAVTVLALAAPAAWLGGAAAAIGVAGGGALAVANLWWLSHRAGVGGSPRSLVAWSASVGLRFGALALAVVGLLITGWAHPVALVAGLSVLPPILIVAGLRDARLAG